MWCVSINIIGISCYSFLGAWRFPKKKENIYFSQTNYVFVIFVDPVAMRSCLGLINHDPFYASIELHAPHFDFAGLGSGNSDSFIN